MLDEMDAGVDFAVKAYSQMSIKPARDWLQC